MDSTARRTADTPPRTANASHVDHPDLVYAPQQSMHRLQHVHDTAIPTHRRRAAPAAGQAPPGRPVQSGHASQPARRQLRSTCNTQDGDDGEPESSHRVQQGDASGCEPTTPSGQ